MTEFKLRNISYDYIPNRNPLSPITITANESAERRGEADMAEAL